MPRVAPFRGLHYSLDRFGGRVLPERARLPDEVPSARARLADITDLVCPPYDVISDAQRRELQTRHPRNAVRLEYSPEPDPHAAAAEALEEWLADGTLERAAAPVAYRYRHATSADPDQPRVEGIVVRVLLEPWGEGVRPHEHTMPGPKADRLGLLRATGTQLSPILSIYFDRSARQEETTARPGADEWRARDGDGLLHQLSAIEADDRLLDHLGRQALFVADGHHRYETALAHQAEARADPRRSRTPPGELGADWIMMLLVNAARSELEIRPTHRLLLDGDTDALRALVSGTDPTWRAMPVAPTELARVLDERRDGDGPAFGIVLAEDDGYLLIGDRDGVDDRLRREAMSPAVRGLDLAALHVGLLQDRLGIGPEEVASGTRLAYTRSEADARARVARGDAAAAILVRPTRLDQLAEVASAGDVMPQKSTYFYPKLLTGMVFNPLED